MIYIVGTKCKIHGTITNKGNTRYYCKIEKQILKDIYEDQNR